MADVLFLLITVAFFAMAAGFVRLCDKVIGPDSDALPAASEHPAEAVR